MEEKGLTCLTGSTAMNRIAEWVECHAHWILGAIIVTELSVVGIVWYYHSLALAIGCFVLFVLFYGIGVMQGMGRIR